LSVKISNEHIFEKTRYIDTILTIRSFENLTPLANFLTPEEGYDPNFFCTQHGINDNGEYYANFNAYSKNGNFENPDDCIAALLDGIEHLPEEFRSIWAGCFSRTLDMGFNCGIAPRSITTPIYLENLLRMQPDRVDIAITIYSHDPVHARKSGTSKTP